MLKNVRFAALLALTIAPLPALAAPIKAILYKNPQCTCCEMYADYLRANGFDVQLKPTSPMELKRYRDQLRGLAKYIAIPEIPSDPYDIAAGVAQKVMPYYDVALTPGEQASYQYAMDHSEEKGPCCYRCWRWTVFGGLAKFLIREHHFTGEQVTEVWDLSDGCGGD